MKPTARMIKRKRSLTFEGLMVDGSEGFTKLSRETNRVLHVGNTAFRCGYMTVTPKQAIALRKWLEGTE